MNNEKIQAAEDLMAAANERSEQVARDREALDKDRDDFDAQKVATANELKQQKAEIEKRFSAVADREEEVRNLMINLNTREGNLNRREAALKQEVTLN